MTRPFEKYRERLAQLSGMRGQRNASLLGLTTLAVMAGLTDEQIEAEVIAASGTPPLSKAEVRHALRTARRDTIPVGNRPAGARWVPPPKRPPPLGSGASSFVARMIEVGQGAELTALRACSPVPIPSDTKRQTATFLQTLYDPAERLFVGDRTDRGQVGMNIRATGEWMASGAVGPFLIANPLTGQPGRTKEGRLSFRCASCVASHRFALVEFDAMPLPDQMAFWAGVIQRGPLPLRSLTHSGGKSLHGLVEIGAATGEAWRLALEVLLYATCHPNASQQHRADAACKNPDRLSRLPGVMRPDKGVFQTLLWLSAARKAAQ